MTDLLSPNRRRFLCAVGRTAAAIAAGASRRSVLASAAELSSHPLPPIVVFSKFNQELKLDFAQSALVTAAAGLDGIDCAVRPGGEILPERAVDDMPRYAAALGERGVRMLLLTTGILSTDSPHAHDIVASGKKLGIRDYRLGFWSHRPQMPAKKLVAEIRASLKDLASMNRQMEMCALFENHSSPPNRLGYAGGNLDELHEIVKDFDSNQISIAFDLAHAIITHGDAWRSRFERLKDHIRVVYLKDVRRPATFVRFGDGEFARTGFFELLQRMNYHAPLSIHIEYAWAARSNKTQAAMIETLKHNRQMVAEWWQHAEAP